MSTASTIIRNIDNTSNILFQDDFNRANGSIGSNYQAASGSVLMAIINNQIYPANNAPFSAGIATTINCISTGSVIFEPDQEAEMTHVFASSGDRAGACVRINPTTSTGYCIATEGGDFLNRRLIRADNQTTEVVIGTTNLVAVSGDILSLRAVGSRLTVYRNGRLIDSVIDTTYTSGQPGIFYKWDNVRGNRLDNFKARSLENTFDWSSTGTIGRAIGTPTQG